jgi:cytosine/adenosine deaminase-related metal-dependent hydrolase
MEQVDLLVHGWHVVTMNETRDIIRDGAVAVRGSEIVAVGKRSELESQYEATRTIGGDRFVVTPGMVNTHIHITGEPLTRGYVPDDTPFDRCTRPKRSACRASWRRSRCSSRARPRSSRPARSASSTR